MPLPMLQFKMCLHGTDAAVAIEKLVSIVQEKRKRDNGGLNLHIYL